MSMEEVEFDMDAPLSQSFKQKRKVGKKESQAPANKSPEAVNSPEHGPFLATTEIDMDVHISQEFNQKKKARKKNSPASVNKSPEEISSPGCAPFPSTAKNLNTSTSSDILVSEFNYSLKSHFKDIATITKLCGYPETSNVNLPEIKRLSNSITFLREWRDFKYAPRVLRFAYQHNLKEKKMVGGITLPQFSSASVPKETQNGGRAATESRDFVMNVGGAVWALDWCPRVDYNSDNHIKSEFIAVAAHPPESSYHKIGIPLTGRGAIQIWCLLTVYVKEDVPSHGSKNSRLNKQKKGTAMSNETSKPKRGRPRKKPINNPVEEVDTDSLNVQPLAVEFPEGSTMPHSSDRSSGSTSKHAYNEDSIPSHTEQANMLLLAPEVGQHQVEAAKVDKVQNNGVHIPKQFEHGESAIENQTTSLSQSLDASTSSNTIPTDVALPRMMLCLAHNGKVAWDVKWRPVRACDPKSTNSMGYLAVLLGNGSLEVWEVPYPHIVKLLYPTDQKHTDPRFVKLQPVFRCSMLKCGNRQSIPLTVEWSVSSSNDLILAGCHDGVVALWKFSVTDSSTETRPLLSFSADTGPIRTLAWAPTQSDRESANIIVTASHKGFKFWDIRDPFRPLWDYPLQGVTFGLDWLPDPGCVFGSIDDGTMWLQSLARAAIDIPVTGKSFNVLPKQGFHIFMCSSFSIWSVHASWVTGMVAYCGEEGTIFCFKPTVRSLRNPSRNRMHHYLCGSLLEEESALIVVTPSTNSSHRKMTPNLKRNGLMKFLDRRAQQQIDKDQTPNQPTLAICNRSDHVGECRTDESSTVTEKETQETKQSCKNVVTADYKVEKDEELEVFPPKSVAMHRARWNTNKGSERWLCYGGAAGMVRCHEVDISGFQ